MSNREFALRKVIWPGKDHADGLALCYADTGELVPGQVDCTVKTEPGMMVVTATLKMHGVRFFDGDPLVTGSEEPAPSKPVAPAGREY